VCSDSDDHSAKPTVLIVCSWTIGYSVAYTTRKAQLRSKGSILASRKRIRRRRLPRRMRRSRWLCYRHHQPRPRRQERWMITCISTRQILCRGCTQIRAARSMWCRQNSRARCRAILIITWMPPWIFRSRLNFRGIIRCRRFRTCSCICRSRFEVIINYGNWLCWRAPDRTVTRDWKSMSVRVRERT